MVFIEEGKFMFVHKVIPEKTQRKTSCAENSKLLAVCKVFEGLETLTTLFCAWTLSFP